MITIKAKMSRSGIFLFEIILGYLKLCDELNILGDVLSLVLHQAFFRPALKFYFREKSK